MFACKYEGAPHVGCLFQDSKRGLDFPAAGIIANYEVSGGAANGNHMFYKKKFIFNFLFQYILLIFKIYLAD